MSEEKYLNNPWIQHYLAEADEAVDEYLAARNRGDMDAVSSSLIKMEERAKWIKHRKRKIDQGKGDSPNGVGGWNPPGLVKTKKDLPPTAVRAEEGS